MIITGTIEKITHKAYYRDDKKINYYEVLVVYNFYNNINHILLLSKDIIKWDKSKDKLFVFEFEPATKYVNQKLTTDFYLKSYKEVQSKSGKTLTVVTTYYEKKSFEVLHKQEVKGRVKVFGKFISIYPDVAPLYCYFWEDNYFLVDLNKVEKIQLNCKSLPYKDKYISNIEVWRTLKKDNFIGSIL
ncbi:hypothetical protein AB4865_12090 [Capnocytophaga sp. ARDL2]|uniref:hypothetical protein n=1 Tax=Capnocytophaga sp. ARDL2 TaxID=3238809 RepID=UPI0035588AE7